MDLVKRETKTIYDLSLSLLQEYDETKLLLLFSKLLSIGILFGSVFVKLPQIYSIYNSKSTIGLSLLSIILENMVIYIQITYNLVKDNPVSTFGELFFILIQNSIILYFIFKFNSNSLSPLIGIVAVVGSIQYFTNYIDYFQFIAIFIGIFAKLPQIFKSLSEQSTGQLSLVSTFLQFGGSLARVFTTLQEVDDVLILVSATSTFVLNFTLLFLIVYFNYIKGGKTTSGAKKTAIGDKKKKE